MEICRAGKAYFGRCFWARNDGVSSRFDHQKQQEPDDDDRDRADNQHEVVARPELGRDQIFGCGRALDLSQMSQDMNERHDDRDQSDSGEDSNWQKRISGDESVRCDLTQRKQMIASPV